MAEQRLLHEGADPIKKLLVDAAREDAPPNATARGKTLVALKALGSGATIAAAAGTALNTARPAAWLIAKWFAVGALAASAIAAGTELARRAPAGVQPSTAADAPTTAPLAPTPTPPSALAVPSPGQLAKRSQEPAVVQDGASKPNRVRGRTTDTEMELSTPSRPMREATPAPQAPAQLNEAHPQKAPGGEPSSSGPSATSLREEIALLESVRAALAASDPASALALLARYDARFPGGALADEAAVLRVKSLMAAGRRDEARQSAQRFAEKHPASTYATRMRALVGP